MATERGRAFEQAAAARVHAPGRREQPLPQRPAPPQGVPQKRRTAAQERAEKLQLQKRVAAVMVSAALVFAGLAVLTHMRARLEGNNKEYQENVVVLEEKRSEKVELEMKIAALYSLDRVEKIAREKLGMVEYREQFHYVLSQGGDRLSVN